MEFSLTEKEEIKYKVWLLEHNKSCSDKDTGAIGGRMTFQFTPTSLGIISQVKCACGETSDLTDYKGW